MRFETALQQGEMPFGRMRQTPTRRHLMPPETLCTIVYRLCYGQGVDILRRMNRKSISRSRPRDQEVLMRDQAYAYIQKKILSGDLPAGGAVSELNIAKELGSSRTPIREALGQLVAEGLLEQIPNRGAVVVQFGRQDIVDLFELREALEAFAVEKVARGRLGNDQRMPICLRHQIHEAEHLVGLIDFETGSLAAQDLGEDIPVVVVAVEAHVRAPVAKPFLLVHLS